MNGPVNLLEILNAHASGIREAHDLSRGKRREEIAEAHGDFVEAVAAVAELIAFVQDCADGRPEFDAGECRTRAIALMPRIGGAK